MSEPAPLPEPQPVAELDDDLHDSHRPYLEQLARYKTFQGKPLTTGRYDGIAPPERAPRVAGKRRMDSRPLVERAVNWRVPRPSICRRHSPAV
jgi:hypothetical protein